MAMKSDVRHFIVTGQFLQDGLILTLSIDVEVYRAVSPFLVVEKFNGQMLPFVNPGKICRDGELPSFFGGREGG